MHGWGRSGLLLAAVALMAAGCGSDSSAESGDPPAEETTTAAASETPSPSDSASPSAGGTPVIEEDFSADAGVFPTGEDEAHRVAVEEGVLSGFIAGQGVGENRTLNLPAALPEPAEQVTIEAAAEFSSSYGKGDGGWGLRCYVNEDYYGVFWNTVNSTDAERKAFVVKSVGGEFDVVEDVPQPEGAVGGDGVVQMRAACTPDGEGGTDVSLTVGGVEAISYSDPEGLGGPFEGISLSSEWNGEKLAPGDYGPRGGGLYYSWDDVKVFTD